MAVLYGVDVSAYQGNIDWPKVHAAGIRYAFAKVSEGTHYTASTWPSHRAGMLALGDGFQAGAYHFLRADTDPAAQARHFLAKAGDLTGIAVALDVERSGSSRPTAAQARVWVAEFKKLARGHPVIGYYPRWYWDETGRPDLSFFDGLWASRYVSGTGTPPALYGKVPESWWTPYGGKPVALLQFTSSATVPGIAGRCDADAYRGSLAQLHALTLGNPKEEPPVPSASDVLKIARAQLGQGEHPPGSNRNKYTKWYGLTGPWCDMFVSWVFNQAKALHLVYGKSAYVPSRAATFKAKGRWGSRPRVGALVFFDLNGNGGVDHIGIVEAIRSDGRIVTIEGNTSDKVLRRVRRGGIKGYGYPAYSGSSKPPPPGKLEVDGVFGPATVRALQRALNKHGAKLAVDGEFGPATKQALQKFLKVTVDGMIGPATVRALQRKVGATSDGDWGPATTKALQRALNAGSF